jgi:Undecaprenyl-phosphate glucose phosphotransferase
MNETVDVGGPEGNGPSTTESERRRTAGSTIFPGMLSMTRLRPSFFVNFLLAADLVALLIAGLSGHALRFGARSELTPSHYSFIYLSSVVTLAGLHIANSYRDVTIHSLNLQIGSLLAGCGGALFFILMCGFLSGSLHSYSRIWIFSSAMMAFGMLFANRVMVTRVVRRTVDKRHVVESIIVVGATERAEKMINALDRTSPTNIDVLGIFDDRTERNSVETLGSKIIGSTDQLIAYVRTHRVDRVVVTFPWTATDRINSILKKLRTVPVRIDLVPNDVIWQFRGIKMDLLGGVPILTIANGRVESQIGFVKRVEDVALSGVLLLLISPLLILIACAVRLDSRGPVFFKQRRHGFNNQIFEVYKFRTMSVSDAANKRIEQATRDDPRITRVGRFLRRSSLDELPQLLNVLMGHMSIVGPRPHAVQHNVEFGAVISEYFARHNVRPGITGWAQINGLRGATDTIEKMHRRVDADLYYIENWSLMLDIKIIFLTAFTVWFQENAY